LLQPHECAGIQVREYDLHDLLWQQEQMAQGFRDKLTTLAAGFLVQTER
jgi:hypothetical protein